jgi:hypothetical protein
MSASSESHQVVTVRLQGPNYSYWAYLMSNFLKGRGLWKFVTGEISKTSQDTEEDDSAFKKRLEEWEMNNSKIISWVANTVIPALAMQLEKFATAKDTWDFLARRCVQSDFARRYKLELDLKNLKQKKGQSVLDFHGEIS